MTVLSPKTAKRFFDLCDHLHEVWKFGLVLFDNKTRVQIPPPALRGMHFINDMFNKYWMLELTKLHDNSTVANKRTLGVNTIIELGGWDAATRARLEALRDEMEAFVWGDNKTGLKAARNMLLCHNSFDAYHNMKEGETLGRFAAGQEVAYFEKLQEFVNIVSMEVFGNDHGFLDAIEVDASDLIHTIIQGSRTTTVST
jgi:hypothetical protein